ncbi:PA containing protein [Actinomycetospora sp. C-140]
MIDNSQTMSFDRMRSMLVRAAEVRDSEQQQIFDSLDEIHGRLAALDGLGAMRKRLSEVPDRTEMSVLAERLDETVAKLDSQESSISSLARLVEGLVDRVAERLATPFAQLDGRLDGVSGRFEGVAGRMDGLEDRISGLHKRLDDLDNKLDRHEMRLDGLPSAVTGPMRERVDAVDSSLRDRLDDLARGVSEEITGTREAARSDATTTRSETTEQVGELTSRLEALTGRLDQVGSRLDGVETGLNDRVGALSTSVENGLDRLDGTLVSRPDHEAVVALVRQANEESERRNAGHLDEAMATFAEIILGPGGGNSAPMPAPRPTARRGSRKPVARDSQVNGAELPTESSGAEG